jgi:hypothetical protein
MNRRMKRKLYRKAKELFQKSYMLVWMLSIYFMIAIHKFASPEDMKFFLRIFLVTSVLAIPKLIIYLKEEKNRKDIYEMIKRG